MNNRVRARVRIVVLFTLPLVGAFVITQFVAEVQTEQLSGASGVLRALMFVAGLGAFASFWLHSYDRARFLHALFFTGLAFCLVSVVSLAIDMLRFTTQHDLDPIIQAATRSGVSFLMGAYIAVKGFQRARAAASAGGIGA